MFGSHFSDHKKSAYAAEARQYESMSSDDVAELFANNLVASVAPGLMKNTPTRLAEYVQFHSMDDPDLYPSKIFGDPNNFEPYKDWRGRIIWWGILPVFPEDSPYAGHVDYGDVHILMRRKMNHNLYMGTFKESEIRTTPEVQFTDVLIEKKISELSSMDLGDLTRRDYRLKITLDDITDYQGNPRIWREFSVSGGISIAALADKVITPVMGWVRNYHAHAYTVFEDGAVFGPTESRAVDKMHMQSVGWNLIPEKSSRGNWTLAHLLQREGQEMIWLYDYGDNYTHYIRVEEIASVNDSTGKVAILDGSGACPREDGDGNSKWKEDIAKLASPHQPVRAQVVESIRNALNYKGKTISSDFDPDNFDIIEARERVHAALASPDSVWSGPKTWVMPLREDFGTKRMPGPPGSMDPLRRGQKYQRTSVEGHESEFMQEVVSSKRDKKSTSCCWSCGNPHDLMSCARCHKPLYCGTECQTAHWKASHKRECRKP